MIALPPRERAARRGRLGVLLAVVLNNSRREKLLVTVFLMPMMMAPVIAGLVWYYLYNGTFGWYHWLLESAGILGETSILGARSTAMIGIVIVDVWQWTPLITLITLAGLKRVPRDQLEANMVDGAGVIRNFFQRLAKLPQNLAVEGVETIGAVHRQCTHRPFVLETHEPSLSHGILPHAAAPFAAIASCTGMRTSSIVF